jgi:hypothetical protein
MELRVRYCPECSTMEKHGKTLRFNYPVTWANRGSPRRAVDRYCAGLEYHLDIFEFRCGVLLDPYRPEGNINDLNNAIERANWAFQNLPESEFCLPDLIEGPFPKP